MRLIVFIAIRQLWARKLLNGIAVSGVLLGVVTLLSVRAMLTGFSDKFVNSVLQVSPHVTLFDKELRPAPPLLARIYQTIVAAQVSHQSPSDRQTRIKRPEDIVGFVERRPGVVAASASLVGSALLALGTREYSVEVRGVDAARQERVTPIGPYLEHGRHAAFAASSDGILVGIGIATRLGVKLGDVLICTGQRGSRLRLKVAGIFDSNIPQIDGSRVYVSLRNAQTLLGRADVVNRIEVRLADPECAPLLAQQLEHALGYDAESWQEANANFLGMIRMNDSIVNFIVAAILAVGGFAILAIQIMIVLQKTRDIAILRSVGFNRSDVLSIFLLQGMIIGLVGATIGNVLGHWLLSELATLKAPQESFVRSEYFLVSDDPAMYVYSLAFALSIGLIASLIPALRGSKVEPVDVLRGQLG